MAMGRAEGVQNDLMATWAKMPGSPGHAFYDRLQELLREGRFDAFVEQVCKPYYAPSMGAPSLPPGRYFRMHMIGYFEGIDSERGIVWRCADSFSLRDFLRLSRRQGSRSFVAVAHALAPAARGAREGVRLGCEAGRRARPGEGRADWRRRLDDGGQCGLAHDPRIKSGDRCDNGESYREMLTRMAKESGIDTPSAEDLARFDRKRKRKTLSNADWMFADKGYHARDQLKALDDGVWKTRVAEPEPAKGYLRWDGDAATRKTVDANRARLKSWVGRETKRRRGELVERSFAHVVDRGGMRRAWLRLREKIHKRYVIHVARFNLGVLTPRRPHTPQFRPANRDRAGLRLCFGVQILDAD